MTIRNQFTPGDDMPTAEEWNAILKKGDSLGQRSRPIRAILSGDANPYSFDELDGQRTGEDSAYELNNVEDLGGKNVMLYPSTGDDFVFVYRKAGEGGLNTIIIKVTECGVGVSGRTVYLTNGVSSFSQVTDTSANATFSGLPDGSWTASLAGDSNWNDTVLPPIAISGGASITREMNRSPKGVTCSYRLDLQFTGCNTLGFAGANVYLSGGGFSFSGVTDASGHWYLYLPPGSITWSLTHDIDVTRGTIQGNPTAYTFVGRPVFGGLSFQFNPNTSGWHCIATQCVFPVPNILNFDSDDFGPGTYQWADLGPGNRTWYSLTGNGGRLNVPSGDTVLPIQEYGVITSASYTVISCVPYLVVGTVNWGAGNTTNYTIWE